MDEIVLDKKTFEALAMETRVKILKALNERRKTQSELSKELELAPSTVSEHLEKMLDAGLIARKKDHHKWIYYELTEKGKHILSPQKASVFVFALSLTLLVAVFGYMMLSSGSLSAAPMSAGEKSLGAAPLTDYSSVQPQDYTLLYALAALVVLVSGLFFLNRVRKQRAVKY